MQQEPSQRARRKAAAYATRPSLSAPTPGVPAGPGPLRRLLAGTRTVAAAVLLAAAPPLLLWRLFGNPAALLPTGRQLHDWTNTPDLHPTEPLKLVGIYLLWLLWAAILILLVGSLVTAVAGRGLPRWRLPAPLHRLMFGLAGSAAVGVVNAAHPGTAIVTHAPATTTGTAATIQADNADRGPTLYAGGRS